MLSFRPPLRLVCLMIVCNVWFLNIYFEMGDGNSNFPNEESSKCSTDSFAVPGVSEFAGLPNPNQSPPSWNKSLTKDDFNYMQQLGSLTVSSLIMEVKKLHDQAYQLGLEEAKEMTRGKYLNIFSSRRQR